jgi:hypothetical protein
MLIELRKQKMKALLFGILAGLPTVAHAGVLIDQNLLFLQNSSKTSDTETYTHYHASMTIGATMNRDFYFGWKVNYFSDSQQGSGGTMKCTGLEMGPRATYYLSKSHWTSFSLAYLPVHNSTYTSDQGVVSKLSGSGFDFELAFHPDSFTKLSPGISLLYHLGSYSSSENSSSTLSTVSYSRNGFYPSIYLHWRFGEE